MLVPPASSSAVVVMIRSKSVSICNRSRARLVDSSRNRTFSKGYLNLMHSYGGLLVPRGSKLALLKSKFNAENFIRRLSWSISSDFAAVYSWNACGSLKSRKKSLKTLFWGSRSSMLVPPESSSAVLVMMRGKSVSICNRSLTRLDYSSRNRAFWRGYPNLMHSYGGLREPRGSNLAPLKSTFNAERRLSWPILNGFGGIHS